MGFIFIKRSFYFPMAMRTSLYSIVCGFAVLSKVVPHTLAGIQYLKKDLRSRSHGLVYRLAYVFGIFFQEISSMRVEITEHKIEFWTLRSTLPENSHHRSSIVDISSHQECSVSQKYIRYSLIYHCTIAMVFDGSNQREDDIGLDSLNHWGGFLKLLCTA